MDTSDVLRDKLLLAMANGLQKLLTHGTHKELLDASAEIGEWSDTLKAYVEAYLTLDANSIEVTK